MSREPLYEIVPNISEGRDRETIGAVLRSVEESGAKLLHYGSDADHHRSVLTIAGDAAAVVAASVALAGATAQRIDLQRHSGVHPRIGALDVLPFVPLRDGATMEGAVTLARAAAEQIWQRWRVPSFLYGAAAMRPDRRALPEVRRGGFEGLGARFAAGDRPDVGDAIHPSAGAIAIGARPLLVAFNVLLATEDMGVGRQIARTLREKHGGLHSLRALAFPAARHVQVSLNVTDYTAVPLHRVVECVRTLAAEHDVEIANGELIGCLPLDALTAASAYYLGLAGSEGLP